MGDRDGGGGNVSSLHSIALFIWNPEKKLFLSRSGSSWAKIGLFYFCFYTGLGLFFWANMAIFFTTIDKRQPKYYGMQSQTLANPGMGYRPMPHGEVSLIRFSQGEESSYLPYVDHLQSFLQQHANPESSSKKSMDCGQLGANDSKPADTICNYTPDAASVAACSINNTFGYNLGEPCVVLKMNRIYAWVPEVYSSRTELEEEQDQLQPIPRFIAFEPNSGVGVGCDGENEVDRENLKDITFYPSSGFSRHFYPYTNQNGYKSPLVFAKFKLANRRVAIMVECKLFAKNIVNSGGNERHGTTNFVIVVD